MQVENVIKQALLRLGIDDRYAMDNLPEDDSVINALIRCINVVISEIASDYIEVRKVEKFTITSGVILYDNFAERLINVRKVTGDGGGKVVFKLYPSYLKVEAIGDVVVEYCYLPKTVGLGDSIELSPKVTELLMLNGVLGEYCMINGRYEDSMIYDKRYREMLKIATLPTREIKLKVTSKW